MIEGSDIERELAEEDDVRALLAHQLRIAPPAFELVEHRLRRTQQRGRLLATVTAGVVLVVAIGIALGGSRIVPATAGPLLECPATDLKPPSLPDPAAESCFWNAYVAGTPVRWSVIAYTVEGDPIPENLTFDGRALRVTRDARADRFAGPANRVVWTWQCTTVAKVAMPSDPQRYFFEGNGCSGASSTVAFP